MIVSNRKIVNIKSSFYTLAVYYSLEVNTISKDINIDKLRDRSKLLTQNPLRESLIISNLSSIIYINRMKAQSSNSS